MVDEHFVVLVICLFPISKENYIYRKPRTLVYNTYHPSPVQHKPRCCWNRPFWKFFSNSVETQCISYWIHIVIGLHFNINILIVFNATIFKRQKCFCGCTLKKKEELKKHKPFKIIAASITIFYIEIKS